MATLSLLQVVQPFNLLNCFFHSRKNLLNSYSIIPRHKLVDANDGINMNFFMHISLLSLNAAIQVLDGATSGRAIAIRVIHRSLSYPRQSALSCALQFSVNQPPALLRPCDHDRFYAQPLPAKPDVVPVDNGSTDWALRRKGASYALNNLFYNHGTRSVLLV